MERVTERLLAIVLRVVVEELRFGTEELSIAVDGSWEGLGEPVERCSVEYLVERWGGVRPLEEFLADPRVAVSVRC